MPTIQLTKTEHHLLVDMLERECAHLLNEIVHTDEREYRESLEEQERQTKALLRKVKTNLPDTGETEPQPL